MLIQQKLAPPDFLAFLLKMIIRQLPFHPCLQISQVLHEARGHPFQNKKKVIIVHINTVLSWLDKSNQAKGPNKEWFNVANTSTRRSNIYVKYSHFDNKSLIFMKVSKNIYIHTYPKKTHDVKTTSIGR